MAFNSPTYIVESDDEIDAVVGGRPSIVWNHPLTSVVVKAIFILPVGLIAADHDRHPSTELGYPCVNRGIAYVQEITYLGKWANPTFSTGDTSGWKGPWNQG